MTSAPYLNTPEAYAVTERLDEMNLLDADLTVQLLPVTVPGSDSIHYVLRFYLNEWDSEPISQVHFLENCEDKSKTTVFIDQLNERFEMGWGKLWGNNILMRHLPTLANTRRYKLSLLIS